MTVEQREDTFYVVGNTCKKGYDYAVAETLSPKRAVTSLVRMCDGLVVPVKTDGSIPKSEIFEVLRKIKEVYLTEDVHIGDVIIKDVCDGVDIVATDDHKIIRKE
jgi:CxxC motif-containing protein